LIPILGAGLTELSIVSTTAAGARLGPGTRRQPQPERRNELNEIEIIQLSALGRAIESN
jgi:hypothetical protein